MITFISCGGIRNVIFLGEDYEKINNFIGSSKDHIDNEKLNSYKVGDTLLFKSTINRAPFDMVMLFKNDTCYYQQINVYCSPCADKMVNDILDDKRYKFEAVGAVNFVSKKNKNIILRLTDKLNEEGNCNQITLLNIKN